jgi:hypothetical protein
MSTDGQYQYVRADNSMYRSQNYGRTFSQITTPGYNLAVQRIDANASGQYVIVGTDYGRGYAVSKDYGVTWSVFGYQDNNNYQQVCISYSGNAMYVLNTVGGLIRSLDYGETWAPIHSFGTGGGIAISGIGCNEDGTIVYISSTYDYNTSTQTPYCSRSLDSGMSWTPLSTMNQSVYGKPFVSPSGSYVFAPGGGNGNSLAAYTNNGGYTWSYIPYSLYPNTIDTGDYVFNFDKTVSYGTNLLYQKPNGLKMSTLLDTPLNLNPPTVPSAGSIYFNTNDNRLQIYNGTNWTYINVTNV